MKGLRNCFRCLILPHQDKVFVQLILRMISLSIFIVIVYPLIICRLDIVVVGTGDHFIPIHPDVIAEVGKRGVKLEVQDTRHACGTYNLLKRDRPKDIGAALIPVTDITEGARKMIGKGKSRMVLK